MTIENRVPDSVVINGVNYAPIIDVTPPKNIQLTELLAMYRKARGLSYEQLSRATGMSKTHLHQLETGTTDNPKQDTLIKLAKFYGIPADVILFAV